MAHRKEEAAECMEEAGATITPTVVNTGSEKVEDNKDKKSDDWRQLEQEGNNEHPV